MSAVKYAVVVTTLSLLAVLAVLRLEGFVIASQRPIMKVRVGGNFLIGRKVLPYQKLLMLIFNREQGFIPSLIAQGEQSRLQPDMVDILCS